MNRAEGSPPIALVVAMDERGLIGAGNRLPWRLPADLRHFKAITLGKAVVMGRKTYESIGRPLPKRTNIVVTRSADYRVEGCRIAHGVGEAVGLAADSDEIMIIGGAVLYEACLPLARRIYLTRIHHAFRGDTYFPGLDAARWRQSVREDFPADGDNPYPYSFITLERVDG